MTEGFYLLHKFYTQKEAKEKIEEIMQGWEKKGWSKVNDVPPTDENIVEFLQLMKGLGYPIDYKYKEKLKEVI